MWPIYLLDNFGWKAPEFAYVLFVKTIVSLSAAACFPVIERTLSGGRGSQAGRLYTACITMLVAAVSVLAAFQGSDTQGATATAVALNLVPC